MEGFSLGIVHLQNLHALTQRGHASISALPAGGSHFPDVGVTFPAGGSHLPSGGGFGMGGSSLPGMNQLDRYATYFKVDETFGLGTTKPDAAGTLETPVGIDIPPTVTAIAPAALPVLKYDITTGEKNPESTTTSAPVAPEEKKKGKRTGTTKPIKSTVKPASVEVPAVAEAESGSAKSDTSEEKESPPASPKEPKAEAKAEPAPSKPTPSESLPESDKKEVDGLRERYPAGLGDKVDRKAKVIYVIEGGETKEIFKSQAEFLKAHPKLRVVAQGLNKFGHSLHYEGKTYVVVGKVKDVKVKKVKASKSESEESSSPSSADTST